MDEVVPLGPSDGKRTALVVGAGAGAMVAAAGAGVLLVETDDPDLQLVAAALALVVLLLAAVAVVGSRWRVWADARGITVRALRTRSIRWREVRSVSVRRVLRSSPSSMDWAEGGRSVRQQRRDPESLRDAGLRLVVVLHDESEVRLPVRVGADVAGEKRLTALARALDELNRASSGSDRPTSSR